MARRGRGVEHRVVQLPRSLCVCHICNSSMADLLSPWFCLPALHLQA